MARPQTIETVRRLIAEVCAIEEGLVQATGRLLAYGLDSVRLLDLIIAVEDEFGIQISDSDPDLVVVETVADLADLIDRRCGVTA